MLLKDSTRLKLNTLFIHESVTAQWKIIISSSKYFKMGHGLKRRPSDGRSPHALKKCLVYKATIKSEIQFSMI